MRVCGEELAESGGGEGGLGAYVQGWAREAMR